MGTGIYFIQDAGKLVEMKEERYDKEDHLQELLANYPNLLAGDQINSVAPRRWLLVKREFGLPSEEDGGDRWSLDHLFLDQDAIPTIVEAKRSSDPRLRREVVGQMLDYAANAVVYLPVEMIRTRFEETCQGRDPRQVIQEALGDRIEPEEFWRQVKTNLQAGRRPGGRPGVGNRCCFGDRFVRHNGQPLGLEPIRQHLSDLLSGMYALAGRPDQALVQQRVHLHPSFARLSYQGIPDVRVILYRGEPAMAMLRLPTRMSNGRANLHQGGLGVGVDLAGGLTHHAVQRNRAVLAHPDTGVPVVGMRVPCWSDVLRMARRVAEAVGLGYIGVDIVIDAERGPLLLEANARPGLEANARPGLAIQIANARGLLPRLAEIDALKERESRPQRRRPVIGRVGEVLQRSA